MLGTVRFGVLNVQRGSTMYFSQRIQNSSSPASEGGEGVVLDLWYQERHNDEISLGLHVTKVLASKQSPFQRVDVMETSGFGRILTLDGERDGEGGNQDLVCQRV